MTFFLGPDLQEVTILNSMMKHAFKVIGVLSIPYFYFPFLSFILRSLSKVIFIVYYIIKKDCCNIQQLLSEVPTSREL